MQKRVWIVAVFILLGHIFLLPLTATEAHARTQVTVTFAAGGIVCGIYFVLQFMVGSSLLPEDPYDATALFDKGREGWAIKAPSVAMTPYHELAARRTDPTRHTVAMELLKVRF
ncbi:MAG: hypothetical protein JW943_00470 [Deltaproteobacteria bacterium]|nr:hypothetical protein [Deltaproteobacteria bacterium]